MTVERFIPEDPYNPPNIPVDDMNNELYSYNNEGPATLPLPWYGPTGTDRPRYDLRVLPESSLQELGFVQVPPLPATGEMEIAVWDNEIGNWKVVPVENPDDVVA